MLELIDPDPYSFSKCSWSSCYLPGSVLGIWGGSENKSENPPSWSPHPAGCGQTVNCECAKEGAHTDWEVEAGTSVCSRSLGLRAKPCPAPQRSPPCAPARAHRSAASLGRTRRTERAARRRSRPQRLMAQRGAGPPAPQGGSWAFPHLTAVHLALREGAPGSGHAHSTLTRTAWKTLAEATQATENIHTCTTYRTVTRHTVTQHAITHRIHTHIHNMHQTSRNTYILTQYTQHTHQTSCNKYLHTHNIHKDNTHKIYNRQTTHPQTKHTENSHATYHIHRKHTHNIYKIVTMYNTHTTVTHSYNTHKTYSKHDPSPTHTQHPHSQNTHVQVSMLKCFHVKSCGQRCRQTSPTKQVKVNEMKPRRPGAGVSQSSHLRTSLRVPSSHRSPHRGLMNGS